MKQTQTQPPQPPQHLQPPLHYFPGSPSSIVQQAQQNFQESHSHSHESEQEEPQPFPDLSVSQVLERCQLTSSDLESALLTIKKIKRIHKHRLSEAKRSTPKLKALFIEMNTFFARKSSQKKSKELRMKQKEKRRFLRQQVVIRKNIKNMSHSSPLQEPESSQIQCRSSRCYICSKPYKLIDEVYHQHCPDCSDFSKKKRFQTGDLTGLTALVTGGRIKIGYEIVLKLLRDGAIVYATTRFTHDAVIRFKEEKDFDIWKDRLFLLQCDFMSAVQVCQLINCMKKKIKRLDILINNAAQTLVRPKQFFTFELEHQSQLPLQNSTIILTQTSQYPSLQCVDKSAIEYKSSSEQIDLSQTDQFGQPIDKRPKNTWREAIEDVTLIDCISTQTINSVVPFHLISQLKGLMGGDKPSWVINVSSMEGVFYRSNKTHYHPHTNMAKAALNMITRTSSAKFAEDKIFMNSVDTGWVTNENPYNRAQNHARKDDFCPPLDCIQGAMRVLDPIYLGMIHGEFPFGKFLKNYKQSNW